jgi:hypothetical protein
MEHSLPEKVLPIGSSRGDKAIITALCMNLNCSSALRLS